MIDDVFFFTNSGDIVVVVHSHSDVVLSNSKSKEVEANMDSIIAFSHVQLGTGALLAIASGVAIGLAAGRAVGLASFLGRAERNNCRENSCRENSGRSGTIQQP